MVTFLLVLGQLAAIISVNHLTRVSGHTVYNAAETLHASQQLATEIALMERSVRQYDVVRDVNFYQVYLHHRHQFLQYMQALTLKPLNEIQRRQLHGLMMQEDRLFRQVSQATPRSRAMAAVIDGFWALNYAGRSILTGSQEFIGGEVKIIQAASANTKQQLSIQAAILIAAALLLSLLYSRWVNHPIQELEWAIGRLSEGNLTDGIQVTGPRDLHKLGQELDGLRQRLLRLEQQQVLTLRNFSHELKTPLATIREGLELLGDQVPGAFNEEQADVINIVRVNSFKLQTLIEDLIRLNVAQGEEIELNRQPVELHGLLYEILAEHKLLAVLRGLQVRTQFESVKACADRKMIKAAIQNVLSNAINYSPEGGEIKVILRRDAEAAIMDVIDQGSGVDPLERHKVFQIFYRGHHRPANQVKGSGVGLAIAQAYMRLHKGTIEILNAPTGAHLRITLPMMAECAGTFSP